MLTLILLLDSVLQLHCRCTVALLQCVHWNNLLDFHVPVGIVLGAVCQYANNVIYRKPLQLDSQQ